MSSVRRVVFAAVMIHCLWICPSAVSASIIYSQPGFVDHYLNILWGWKKELLRNGAACVVFNDRRDSEPVNRLRVAVTGARPYRAGRFYERELPCLSAVLEEAKPPSRAGSIASEP